MNARAWAAVFTPIAAAGLLMQAAAGCEGDGDGSGTGLTVPTTSTTSGSGGSQGGSTSSGGSTSQAGNTSSGGSTSQGGSTSSGGGGQGGDGQGGGGTTCGTGAQLATIGDVTSGVVGVGVDVRVEGAIVMSQKFLITKSSAGNCLWGVFVSAPGIATTAPNTGILVASYGTPASIPAGGTVAYCPKLDEEPQGDAIPENVQPGDVVTFVGTTDYFLLASCETEPNGSAVPQRQIAKTCSMQVTGNTNPPAPAVLSGEDVARLRSPLATDTPFHDQWGGVKVRIENVTSSADPVVGDYGIITLDGSNLNVGDKIYYRGYQTATACHAGPIFSSPTTWSALEGFSYLNYCTWGLETNDKCADFTPRSTDCTSDSCAPY